MRLLAGSLSFVVLAACSGGAPAGTPADDPAGRLVARAIETGQATAYDTTANLVFDFEPATDGPVPHRQVICRAAFEPEA